MISVPSRPQLLSGNKLVIFLCLGFLLAACSKKTAPVISTPAAKPAPAEGKVVKKEPPKELVKHSVALLLPFHLDQVKVATAGAPDISRSSLAIDFYQGFKMALDSLSAEGQNFVLKVFDSQEQELRIVNLAMAPSVTGNDLVVGPIFPSSVKTFSEFAKMGDKLLVSPLAASRPAQFNNPNLVTVNNTIDQHSKKIADFIRQNHKPENVNLILINTRKSDDEKFAAPLRRYLKTGPGRIFAINERPNAIGLEGYLVPGKINLVIIASAERAFVMPTIDRLYKVAKNNISIEVFGHPNWLKVQFLNAEKLQFLNARISSSYFIDYHSRSVKHFVSRYRREYGLEPTEYAFKGFDTGYYFGKLFAKYGSEYKNHLQDEVFQGMHNEFRFVRDAKTGYSNTALMMLQFRGFELQVIK